MSTVNRAPMGGTELLYKWLTEMLPDLTSQVQIILSRPEQYVLEDKPRILWLHDLPQDPASACLRDPSYRTKFNKIVFVSNWQQQMYNFYLGIPFSEGIVIKNGVPAMEPIELPKPTSCLLGSRVDCGEWSSHENMRTGHCNRHPNGKFKFIYTSTPHRGLAILAAAADLLALKRQDWELHVYSSLKIYARDEQDAQFEPLYNQLRENPCVVYHGTQSNADVRAAVRSAHSFVYPSTYLETSCMAIQEALMAGCLCITTPSGALIETCGAWTWMMHQHENPQVMAHQTAAHMDAAIDNYSEQIPHLLNQAAHFQQFYSFEARSNEWKSLLEYAVKQGPPIEKFVIG